MTDTNRRSAWGNDRQRVLEATDIVRLVERHVALKKKGREYVGKCPFHDDHKPSMFVVPAKQIYHCFSCGAGGNAIDFVVNFHKMDFREALRHLADEAGVALTPWKPAGIAAGEGEAADAGEGEARGAPTRKDLLEACAFAQEFFVAILKHPEHGGAARAMIERRGISAEMVEQFGIGCAPDRWDGLLLTAQKKGIRIDALRMAGLLKDRSADSGSGEGGAGSGHYDAFRNRLMFPIRDMLGRPIAFGGRKVREEDEPKYLNSPETPLFDKSRTLFALSEAQKAIQAAGRAIVVEGYTDAIACHQAGVCNVVATLGTALTPEHARVLQRLCDEVVLVFDGDGAGLRAADRAIEVFFAQPIDVRIATLAPTGAKDPDELLKREGGREALDGALGAAVDALQYRFDRLRDRLSGAGLSARAKTIEDDVSRLVELGLEGVSPVRRQLIIRRLAAIAGAPESVIVQAIAAGRARRRPAAGAAGTAAKAEGASDAPTDAPLAPAAHALGALLAQPGLWGLISAEERDAVARGAYAVGPSEGRLALAAIRMVEAGLEPGLTAMMADLEDETDRMTSARLCVRVEAACRGSAEGIEASFRDALRALEREALVAAARESQPGTHDEAIQHQRIMRQRFGRSIPVIPRPDPRMAPG